METDTTFERGGTALSALLVNIGTALTGMLAWFTSVLAVIETAIGTSSLLQILLGFVATIFGFGVVRYVIRTVKSIKAGR